MSQLCDVPRVSDAFTSLRVLETIRYAWNCFLHDIGPFPGGFQLPWFLLLEPEHQVPDGERSGAHPTTVVIAQVLLVYCSASGGNVAWFVEEIAVVFECGR